MFQQNDFGFIYKYFMAEKQESLLFMLIGIAGVLAAIVFFFFVKTHPQFYKGLAIPALVIGLLLGIVGFTVYNRSDKQARDVAYQVGMDAAGYIKHQEAPRMEKVMKNFVIYRWTEILLALTGLIVFFLFRNNAGQPFWKGIGLSLAIMALLALTADYFAEKRGKIYLKKLTELVAPVN